jgi:hypothetical protein
MQVLAQFRRMAFALLPPVVTLNFVIFALSFSGWYEGGEGRMGMADRLFRSMRLLGWRADVVWLACATVFAVVALALALPQWRVEKAAKRSALLSISWLVGSLLYAIHAVYVGLLYMG